ncbi:MAG: hypothetical protein R3A44_43040 [Caldilineaceae bacterium]
MWRRPGNASLHYHLFILSLWDAGSISADGQANWRFSLEHSATGTRIGFRNLAELTAYLAEWTQKPPEVSQPAASVNPY